MKAKGILMQAPMVVATLADIKTETRRTKGLDTFNENPDDWQFQSFGYHEDLGLQAFFVPKNDPRGWYGAKFPYGKKGDVLYVREAWHRHVSTGIVSYRANAHPAAAGAKIWKPGIHLRKADSRIWLQITDIGVERLQDITEADCIHEGVERVNRMYRYYLGDGKGLVSFASDSFRSLWELINGDESWSKNPWVWVIGYKVLSKTGYYNIPEDIRMQLERKEVAV